MIDKFLALYRVTISGDFKDIWRVFDSNKEQIFVMRMQQKCLKYQDKVSPLM